MEDNRINWGWLQTTKHSKRTHGHKNTGNTNKKDTLIWSESRLRIIQYLNSIHNGEISFNDVSTKTDVSVKYVYNIMFEIEKNKEVADIFFVRSNSGRRKYYKGYIPQKTKKCDIKMYNTNKPKIDHRLKAQIKEQMEKKTQPKAL